MTYPDKVSVLCRYGGNFVEELDKISYKGGVNRIIHITQEIEYLSLVSKVQEVCKLTNIDSIKYKHPELDWDCLLFVMNDEDVSNMMQVFSQSHGPIQLFVSGAQRTLPIHNLVSRNDEENVEATLENCHGTQERPLEHISNIDINANTSTPIDSQGMDDFGMDSRRLPCCNADDRVNDVQIMKLEEGQEFSDANAFHKFLREYAIRLNFVYDRTRSGKGRFAAKCREPNCLWRIQAVQLPNMTKFKIKSLRGNHTCNMYKQLTVSGPKEHPLAKRRWIADKVEDWNYFDCTPEAIVDKIEKEYGIKVSYDKAWRGKELALKKDEHGERHILNHVL